MGYGAGGGISGIIVSGLAGFFEVALIVVGVVVLFALALSKFKGIK